nr:hypothetical protein [Tanacetum cinerariifolium]
MVLREKEIGGGGYYDVSVCRVVNYVEESRIEDFQVPASFFVIRSIQSQVKSGDDASFLGMYHRVVSFCGHQYLSTVVIRDLFLVQDDSSVGHHPGGRHVYIRISLMRKEVQKKTCASCLISLKGCLFGREQKSFIYKLEYSSRS